MPPLLFLGHPALLRHEYKARLIAQQCSSPASQNLRSTGACFWSRVGSTFCAVHGQHQARANFCRIEPIILSAGELESEWAGAPGRLIRDRYRRAAEVAKIRGKLPCLMINDLDAGVGIQEGVQRTVSFSPSARSPYSLINVLSWHQDFIVPRYQGAHKCPCTLRGVSRMRCKLELLGLYHHRA